MEQWQLEEETQDEIILKQEEEAMLTRMRKKKNANSERRTPIDKQAAFREFKATEAAGVIEQLIIQCRNTLKSKRVELANKTESINVIKREIDRVKSFLDQKNEEKTRIALTQSLKPGFTSPNDAFDEVQNDQAEVIDEEELQRLRELKELKRQYRETYKELKELQKETKFTQEAIDRQKTKLITDFEEWYNETFEDETALKYQSSMVSSLNHQASRQTSVQVSSNQPYIIMSQHYRRLLVN